MHERATKEDLRAAIRSFELKLDAATTTLTVRFGIMWLAAILFVVVTHRLP